MLENHSLNLTVLASAYPLPINYSWLHPTGQQLSNDSQLLLMNIQRTDAGMYRCLASNSLGSTEANFTLKVLGKSHFKRSNHPSFSLLSWTYDHSNTRIFSF